MKIKSTQFLRSTKKSLGLWLSWAAAIILWACPSLVFSDDLCPSTQPHVHWSSEDEFWRDLQEARTDFLAQNLLNQEVTDEPGPLLFQDPVQPIRTLLITRDLSSPESVRFSRDILKIVHEIDPSIETRVIEFQDYAEYEDPSLTFAAGSLDEDFSNRDLKARLVQYQTLQGYQQTITFESVGPWKRLRMVQPALWARDFIHIFQNPADSLHPWHLTEVPHRNLSGVFLWGVLSEVQPVDFSMNYFHPSAGSSSWEEIATVNDRDYGGNLVPVSQDTAIVDTRMSNVLKQSLRSRGLRLIETLVQTEVGHADEYFSVVPAPRVSCRIGLIHIDPQFSGDEENGAELVAQMKTEVGATIDQIKVTLNCPDLVTLALPVTYHWVASASLIELRGETRLRYFAGSGTVSVINALNFPRPYDSVSILPALSDAEELSIEAKFRAVEDALGQPVRLKWIDATFLSTNKGNVHCATNEMRSGR